MKLKRYHTDGLKRRGTCSLNLCISKRQKSRKWRLLESIEGLFSKQGQLLGFSNLRLGRFKFWLLNIWIAIEINGKVHHTYNNNMKYQKTVPLNQVVMMIYRNRQGSSKARFRRRTFQEPNLIHWNKYMKSSASESIRNAYFNLERLRRSFRPTRSGISPLEWLWNGFDSGAELFNNNNNNFIYIALKSDNCPKRYIITKKNIKKKI